MSYPFSSIWVNGRVILLEKILNELAIPHSAFEDHTFSFIRQWLSDEKIFSMQTSGSTGDPKFISFTREQMIASARLTEKALTLKSGDHALVCIDTRYIGGKMMLVRSFTIGMKVLAIDPCACPLQKIPVDQCVNFAAFVPYQLQSMLVSKHPHLVNTVDNILIGGAPIDEKIIEVLQQFCCRCYATYGMTETISHVALRALNGKYKMDFFHALEGVTLVIDDRGCLCISAPYLPEIVVTNDLVNLLNSTTFQWLGRWDNVINTGGVKVIPEKIEAAVKEILNRLGIYAHFFVHGQKDQSFGSRVVMVLEASEHTSKIVEQTIEQLPSQVSPYEIPKEILLSPHFIFTDTGKINRSKTLETIFQSIPLKK
jgi:O-succinylbenzoic acid--CoA ligase